LSLSKRGAHNRRKQNRTKRGANFSRHLSFAWRDRSLARIARAGRFMRLGWRYHWVIRTFRNHAAVSFSQCTGALSVSQGSVFGDRSPRPGDLERCALL
jgi:hypothetical protein